MMFDEKDRQIYVCPYTARKYDPLAVKRAITVASGKPGRFKELVGTFRAGGDPAIVAQGELVAIGREALGLPAVDPKTGEGVLDVVVWDALTAFTGWLKGKEPRVAMRLDSPPCAGCP